MNHQSLPEQSLADGASAGSNGSWSLVAEMYEDLTSITEAIVGYAQVLADDAEDYPADYRADLNKLVSVSRELYAFVKQNLEPSWPEAGSPLFDERLRELRHDLGNRLSHVIGYCQLLLMDEDERLFGSFQSDLKKIKQLCTDGEASLRRYKKQSETEHSEAGPPADAGAAPSNSDSADLAPTGTAAHKPADPATVLVADDNQRSRDVLARILQRDGHAVTVASSGREALDILEETEFDLVLLDFLMPEMTGYQVLKAIKDDERLRHTPVIIVSALDTMHEVVACIEIGAEDFLTKPVDLQLLRARVNACLEKKRLREREFGQFFTPELARHFVRHPELLKQGREAEVSVLFCDIRQFSHISERLGPRDTVDWLSDVMAALSDCVINQRGVLVDYIGDQLMAMWGAPEKEERHAELACRAAIEMLETLPGLNERWEPVIGEPTEVGIGLNTGLARVGNTGSRRKFKYGPLGNTVNLASRVQGATKYLGTDLLVTGDTYEHLGSRFAARRLCTVRVVNIECPVELYEILTDDSPTAMNLKLRYEQALGEFENQQFRMAASILGNVLVDHPHDGPSLLLMSRVIDALLHPPADFDPVAEFGRK